MIVFVRSGLGTTLLSGKPVNLVSPRGRVRGAKVDPDGTLNVPSWLGEITDNFHIETA
jgi:hypothetical protein